MSGKVYVESQHFLEDSFRLGYQVLDSGFKPKFIVGVWRGGSLPGTVVQEILEYHDIKTDHIAIRTSSYIGMQRKKEVRVHALEYVVSNITPSDDLLIVDDVFDTGNSVAAIIEKLKRKCRFNMPNVVKIATVFFKPECNLQSFSPDYYIHATDAWVVFPHELEGLTPEEIKDQKKLDLQHFRDTAWKRDVFNPGQTPDHDGNNQKKLETLKK